MDSDDDDLFALDDDENLNLSQRRLATKPGKLVNDVEVEDNRTNFGAGFEQFTQRTQMFATNRIGDDWDKMESKNDFEKILSTIGLERKEDMNGEQHMFIVGSHSELLQRIKGIVSTSQKTEELMTSFEVALINKEDLMCYVKPIQSSNCGIQDSLFRAMLLCPPIQTKVFNLLIHNLQILASGDSDECDQQAMALASQIRFLDCIVDGTAFFEAIFNDEIDFEKWRPKPRDSLIETLPEVILNPVGQQEAAWILHEMFLKGVTNSCTSYRLSIISALGLLRTDGVTAKKIRNNLASSMMNMDLHVIPPFVNFCFTTLAVDKESSLKDILRELSERLKLDKLRKSSTKIGANPVTPDSVTCQVFEEICHQVHLCGPNGWKQAVHFLRKGNDRLLHDGHDESGEELDDNQADDEEGNQQVKYSLFDVLLTISLLSMDGCPSSVVTTFKNTLIQNEASNGELMEILDEAISAKTRRFYLQRLDGACRLSRECLWSPDNGVRQLGAYIYRQIFLKLQDARQKILDEMLSHLSNSDAEAEAVLQQLEHIAQNGDDAIQDFAKDIHNCINLIDNMSTENIKRFFSILIFTSTDPSASALKHNLDESINKFLCSVNEREQIWGVLGIITKLIFYLLKGNQDSEREIAILLSNLKKDKWFKSRQLRSFFYEQIAKIFRDNQRIERCNSFMAWFDELRATFRDEFFTSRAAEMPLGHMESEKYTTQVSQLWLDVPNDRLIELVPLFELLKEASLAKQRWTSDDDTQTAITNHFSIFFFAFEANVCMPDISPEVEEDNAAADRLYHTVDWIRILLNTFANTDSVPNVDNKHLDELWMKKFTLMFHCQNRLISRLSNMKRWTLPLCPRGNVVVVNTKSAKATKRSAKKANRSSKKARKDAGDNDEKESDKEKEDDQNESDGEAEDIPKVPIDSRDVVIQVDDLPNKLKPIKLAAIVKLILLLPNKRRMTSFLVSQLLSIVKLILPKRERKALPFWTTKTNEGIDPSWHGDSKQIWELLKKVLPTVWTILNNATEFFRDDLNNSDLVIDKDRDLMDHMGSLMNVCLQVFSNVLSSNDLTNSPKDPASKRTQKQQRRRILMEKLEHVILDIRKSQDESDDDAELTFLKFLVGSAELVPFAEVAVSLLDTTAAVETWTNELRQSLARRALHYLKREWRDSESNPIKGAPLNSAVRQILDHYLKLRSDEHRLLAIQWILAHKVSELIPDDERRRSKMASFENHSDPEMSEVDARQRYAGFNRYTFSGVYKVLFSTLNATVDKQLNNIGDDGRSNAKLGEYFRNWTVASSSFCLMGLMLRVKDLRNATILMTAVREGKRFLNLVSKRSSFIGLMSSDRDVSLSKYADDINAIIKGVQIGNRTLQNVSVYAKTMKSASLLKTLPELRAASELWMRAIQSAIVELDCHDLFQIDLLKSRDIDGEEIRHVEERIDDEDSSDETSATVNDEVEEEDGDGSRTSDII